MVAITKQSLSLSLTETCARAICSSVAQDLPVSPSNIIEVKDAFDELPRRLSMVKERIRELGDRSIEISQTEMQGEKSMTHMEPNI